MVSVIFGADDSSPSVSATNYNFINACNTSTWLSTETLRDSVMPGSYTVSNFYMQLVTAPGVGKSQTFTVMKNGVATGVTVTISDTNTTATDSVHAESFSAADTLSLQCVPTGTPTATGGQYWHMECSGTGQPLLASWNTAPSTLATSYNQMMGGGGSIWASSANDNMLIMPAAGTLSMLYVKADTAPGGAAQYAYTLMKNGVAQSVTLTMAGASTTGSDTTNSFSVASGDWISIRSVPTSSPASSIAVFGAVFTPTVDGESIGPSWGSRGNNNAGAPATQYNQPQGVGAGAWNATESPRYVIIGAYTLKAIYVGNRQPQVGGLDSQTFTLRNEGVDTALSAALTGTSQTANSTTADVPVSEGNRLSFKVVATAGGSAGAQLGISTRIYIAPPAPAPSGGSTLLMMGI